MDLEIDGRTALVTGSSRGIGFACAEALADAGCDVAINARRKDRLDDAARKLEDRNVDVAAIPGDVADPDDVERIADRTRRELDDPDILVANAGGPPAGGFTEIDDAAWRDGFEQTVMSAVRLSRAVLPRMRDTGWGRIVHVTSTSVERPIDGLVLSTSLRRAVVGMAEALSSDVARDGVTVNCVAPGSTATDRIHELAEERAERAGVPVEEMASRMQDDIPAGRYADPGEIGAAVAYLCSERAGYVTGRTLAVDGGRLATP